jgi:hypothetical protein
MPGRAAFLSRQAHTCPQRSQRPKEEEIQEMKKMFKLDNNFHKDLIKYRFMFQYDFYEAFFGFCISLLIFKGIQMVEMLEKIYNS